MNYYDEQMAKRKVAMQKPFTPKETMMIGDVMICEKGVPTNEEEMQRRSEEAARREIQRQVKQGILPGGPIGD